MASGLDLRPLNLHSGDDMGWLETLVWPEHAERAQRLRAAIEIARANRPPIVRGNLLEDLAAVAASAPKSATLVVFHTAVLGYVPRQSDRDRFAEAVRELGAVWISNEAPNVFSAIAEQAPPVPAVGLFLLSVDGKPVAWTAPHGQSIHWFAA